MISFSCGFREVLMPLACSLFQSLVNILHGNHSLCLHSIKKSYETEFCSIYLVVFIHNTQLSFCCHHTLNHSL